MSLPFRLVVLACLLVAGCSRPAATPASTAPRHEHHPPHGGTPVVLGAELYHLELVRDPTDGRLRAFVLDGEMENFVRIAAPTLELSVTVAGQLRPLMLAAVVNPATGESVGDTSCFEAQADWLKTTSTFDAVLARIEIRGTPFTAVAFNFPKGNDQD